MTSALTEPLLVGREQELGMLKSSLDSAKMGKGGVVFVSGEAGSGKTRLISEFLFLAKQHDVLLLSSGCLSDVAVPYFPFMEAFGAYFSGRNDEVMEYRIKNWLLGPGRSSSFEKSESLTPQAWKDLAFVSVTDALLTIASKKPLILFIDDIHWADSASLSLLHYISRAVGSAQVLVLATFRSEELTADVEGHPHPLAELLRAMNREELYREIKLSTFDKSVVSQIAENMVGGNLAPNLIDKLTRDSQGNALFIVESLRMLSERGNIVQKDGEWHLTADELGIPTKFKDIILKRLAALNLKQRRILDVASVIGEKFNPELLASTLSDDVLDVLEALGTIERSTSLVTCEGDLYKFDHAKSRDIIYSEIPRLLRKGYHNKIAQKLEDKEDSSRNLPFSQIVHHYSSADNKKAAVKYALLAGKDALARFSNAEAIKHFTYVTQTLTESDGQSDERTVSLQGLGEAFYASNNFLEAIRIFEKIYAAQTGIAQLRALRWAMDAAFFQGDTALLLELSKRAAGLAAVDRIEWARARMNRGRYFLLSGDRQKGLEDFLESLQVDEEEYSLADTARTLVGLGPAYIGNGEQEKAVGAELRAIALFEDLQDLRGKMDAYNRLAQIGVGLDLEVERWFTEAIQIGEKIGDYNRVAEASASLAREYEVKGDLEHALSESLSSLEHSMKTDSIWIRSIVYSNLTRLYAKMGNVKLAEEYFAQLSNIPQIGVAYSYTDRALPKAVLLAAKQQWTESMQIFDKIRNYENKAGRQRPVIFANYIWTLTKQGSTEEARALTERAKNMLESVQKKWTHVNVQASLMAPIRVGVGQPFEARLDVINASKKPCVLLCIEGFFLPEFKMRILNEDLTLQNCRVNLNNRELKPFSVASFKFELISEATEKFSLKPQIVYIDDDGVIKKQDANQVEIKVGSTIYAKIGQQNISVPILTGRVKTGLTDLDGLLLGGIPEHYAVALSSHSTDERQLLIRRFLVAGAETGEMVAHITTDAENAKIIAAKYPKNFFLFLCNPQADSIIHDSPNVYKLKGVENLTEIDIAIAKAFRNSEKLVSGTKRACLEIVSDAVLQHRVVNTRRWLSALIPTLKLKGFTILAVIDTGVISSEESEAILGVFDGEIRAYAKETPKGTIQVMKIKRLYNQRYLEDEIIVVKE